MCPLEYKNGYKDYMELSMICSCKKLLLTAQSEIRTMLGGALHPSEDSHSTASARNFQYQLALTAKFELSKLPIKVKEPDFTFMFQGKEYSVAAKRLNGKGEIERNIRKAEKQINAQIIMDLLHCHLIDFIVKKISY
jgi:hypothetical protein